MGLSPGTWAPLALPAPFLAGSTNWRRTCSSRASSRMRCRPSWTGCTGLSRSSARTCLSEGTGTWWVTSWTSTRWVSPALAPGEPWAPHQPYPPSVPGQDTSQVQDGALPTGAALLYLSLRSQSLGRCWGIPCTPLLQGGLGCMGVLHSNGGQAGCWDPPASPTRPRPLLCRSSRRSWASEPAASRC